MPTADYAPAHQVADFLRELAGMGLPTNLEPQPTNLAAEVAALRQSIDALLAELRPASAVIATGAEVLEQYKRLKG